MNGDGIVDVSDLLYIVAYLGTTDAFADISNNGIVDVKDLLIVVGAFGPRT